MKSFQKYLVIPIISILLFIGMYEPVHASAGISDYISFVVLSDYSATMDIGDTLRLSALTSTLKKPTWKSSDAKIASVSSNGVVTARKPGIVTITASSSKAEAYCIITVNETVIKLSRRELSMENGTRALLKATASSGNRITWKSSKSSVAAIDSKGQITAKKPGTTVITASADGSSAQCTVTVKTPELALSSDELTLYRGGQAELFCSSSSGMKVTWKSSKPSVATVSDDGTVTAVKHGTARITARLDGAVAECTVTVESPEIILSDHELEIPVGTTLPLTAEVSSGNPPVWSSSNTSVVSVSRNGCVKGESVGKAYVYAQEDGTKVRCTVRVTKGADK